ncbi:MAG: L-serine ammonia-lyase, iron-sulfur-dependent, subunit alpha [Verrucomicrobia bacterium]|nr:L-serine ammonia-lyase, iron-sulfur-dependent, subunit alpha [Verrucomicrobiota bacterium]MDA1068957.1 L-serine ammonia-lyase, iron-sulfur-dependent, subunit alpha [Verrucomicrobiota bacterium]
MSESNHIPSIFNDVLGPVMRGPSSSHSAAANRIGRLCRDLVEGDLRRAVIEYDPNGSLVTTHKSQGTDMGLYGGFLGWEPDDPRLPDYAKHTESAGLKIEVRYLSYGATHPNNYKLSIEGVNGHQHTMQAISTGGGMIEVTEIDGAPVAMGGDFFETLVYLKEGADLKSVHDDLGAALVYDSSELCEGETGLLRFSMVQEPAAEVLTAIRSNPLVRDLRILKPVLPIMSRKDLSVPFQTVEAMLAFNEGKDLALWELALEYESTRGGISAAEVIEKARGILHLMEDSVKTGLAGTQYADRILPCQSVTFVKRQEEGRLIPGDVMNRIIAYISAILEVKSSMGVIVAAPTAGSCGAMPGSMLAVADSMGIDEEGKIHALLVAGLIGVFIATHATFAAELGGCMAECGSGAGMSAAAMVGLANGTLEQQLAAASVALQNSFGMICDPVGNRVEAPCLGKNVLAGSNALACANMALADYKHLIPLDEVIYAMDEVGKAIPHEHCCTAKGGLSITPTSKAIERRMNAE